MTCSPADRIARGLLLDPPTDPAATTLGLGYVLEAAHHALDPATRPAAVIDAQRHTVRYALHERDWLTATPDQTLCTVADALTTNPGQLARAAVETLHTCYIATHAASRTADRAGDRDLSRLLRAVELGLDTALHQHHHQRDSAPDLLAATCTWSQSAADALERPSPFVHQVIARTAGALVITADHAARAQVGAGWIAASDYDAVLRPALATTLAAWGEQHTAWAALAQAEPGRSRLLADSAHVLHAAENTRRAPDDPSAAIATALVLGQLHVIAQMSHHASRQPTKAPADLVARRLAASYSAQSTIMAPSWLLLERVEGRGPVTIPEPMRDRLAAVAERTVTATQRCVSAAHLLLPACAAPARNTALGPAAPARRRQWIAPAR